jgi:hypothetical protein
MKAAGIRKDIRDMLKIAVGVCLGLVGSEIIISLVVTAIKKN